MSAARVLRWIACLLVAIGVLAYLYDPPWIAGMTSGIGPWQADPSGTRYRWTSGHGSLFVPSDARAATLPLRAPFAGPGRAAIQVRVSVDDRAITELTLTDPIPWVETRVVMPRRPTRRRYRRIDVRVSRTVGPSNLGVQIGELTLDRAGTW